MIISIEGERLSILQVAILLYLADSPRRASDLLEVFSRRGLKSRSSFYTAVYELMNRGYIERTHPRNLELRLTEKGRRILSILGSMIDREIRSLIGVVDILAEKIGFDKPRFRSLADELEDPEDLEEYLEFLKLEMDKVKAKLKGWRKISVG